MAANTRQGAAARRAAHALVHSLGAAAVALQMPALPVADDDGEELGLRTPQFQLQQLSPAAIRRTGDATEVLLPVDALESALGIAGDGAIRAALGGATGVQIGDELFALKDVRSVEAGGSDCLVRLLLQKPVTEVV